ncbi:C39 family peptidase [Pontixanthobacter gangjinensis]|uniref:Peptidase C39 n=1 Tax=Pontixanthobacter gangjinensis TaxID=1028742 RepID=A0A6I4SR76_9SPHN|nr:C39 family peptidase [Pontixanthobacter gangjinensis]MXO57640.1 peptidase C39 [Pontixanthobacter gangjinensis]
MSYFPARLRPVLTSVLALAPALVSSGCMTAPAQNAPLWLGQTSEGAQITPVALTSWNDRKFIGLVRQRTDFSCGAAVMATLFNEAFGRSTTEQQVLVNMLKIADPDIVRKKGFSLLDMKTYALSIGMEAEGYRLDYDKLRELNLPVIALLDIKGYKHFVIIRKAYADRVAVGDPALGNRTMRRADFEESWNEVAFVVAGEGYDPDNALIDPPSPLSAKRLLALHAVLPAAETAEFGNRAAFSFSF